MLGDVSDFAVDLQIDNIGLQMPETITSDPNVKAAATALGSGGNVLRDAATKLDAAATSGDETQLAAALAVLIQGIVLFVQSATQLVDQINAKAATLPEPGKSAVITFCELMARKIIDYLAISTLELQLPRLAFLLKLLGLIDWRVIEASGAPNEPQYVRKDVRLDRLPDLFKDPATHFANIYGWGTPDFDPLDIFQSVLAFYGPEDSIQTGKIGTDAFLRRGIFTWQRDSSVTPPGLLLDISAKIAHQFDQRVTFGPSWGMDFKSDLGLSGGAIFRLKPPFDLSAAPKAGEASGAVSFTVNRNPDAHGLNIIAGNDLVQLIADNAGIGADLTVGASTTGQVSVQPGIIAELTGLRLTLGTAGSDSFIGSLLGSANIKGNFDITLRWTLDKGLQIHGTGGLEIAIPMHQSIGVVTFDTLYLICKIGSDGAFALETSAGLTGQLGPLSASVDRIGVNTTLSFSKGVDSNLGPVNLDLAFKPPSGVGLSVDAGVVKGGGYLFCDSDRGEYAGALSLTFIDVVAVNAIGFISTKMPDGSSGFSLLIIITADFGTGIQLGLGFTLLGVGGLLGLNRTMDLQALTGGVRTGSLNSIMFPKDVVANAPKIISDLRSYFPPREGTFLIGPMAKLGWGTPTLVSLSLGVIIEIPGDIAILGVLKIAIPTDDAALIILQAAFVGALEFDKDRFWFYAALFDSRIVFAPMEGELGLLVAWGADGNFVISVGGFHPSFKPPPLPFPSPRRVSITLADLPTYRIRIDGYFAVTSNTVQFGAQAALFFGLSDLNVQGQIAFDALFQFSPFYFLIDISASFSVNAFGEGLFSVGISGELSGPAPYHIKGHGSISLLFWDIGVDFEQTWGDSRHTTLQPIPILPILEAELNKNENWKAQLPATSNLLVALRQMSPDEADLMLHPVGVLHISQRALPLGLTLDKVGTQAPKDVNKLYLSVISGGLEKKQDATERFAPAQFSNLSDADKLSAPAFSDEVSGFDLSSPGNDLRSSRMAKRIVRYDEIIIDSNYKRFSRRFFNFFGSLFNFFMNGGAVSRCALSQAAKTKLVPFADKISAVDETYTVAFQSNNQAFADDATSFHSEASAREYLNSQIAADPTLAGTIHVIPSFEKAA